MCIFRTYIYTYICIYIKGECLTCIPFILKMQMQWNVLLCRRGVQQQQQMAKTANNKTSKRQKQQQATNNTGKTARMQLRCSLGFTMHIDCTQACKKLYSHPNNTRQSIIKLNKQAYSCFMKWFSFISSLNNNADACES